MYIINFLNSVSSSDTLFYVLMIILALVSVVLFYLIYSQNKEMSKRMEQSMFNNEEVEKVKMNTAVPVNEVENLVQEKPNLVEVTDMSIPEPLELTKSLQLTDNIEDLQSLTKELETLPREKTVNMTAYEALQEETAIISYDELVNKSEQNDLPKLANNDDILTKDLSSDSEYLHEENFLKSLKQLQIIMKESE